MRSKIGLSKWMQALPGLRVGSLWEVKMDVGRFLEVIKKIRKKGAKFSLRDYEIYKSFIKQNSTSALDYERHLKELTRIMGV